MSRSPQLLRMPELSEIDLAVATASDPELSSLSAPTHCGLLASQCCILNVEYFVASFFYVLDILVELSKRSRCNDNIIVVKGRAT